MKSYGRAPTFLLLTGYEQVRSVVAAIAGDWESARKVELVLPETGVCSTSSSSDAASCCGADSSLASVRGTAKGVHLPVLQICHRVRGVVQGIASASIDKCPNAGGVNEACCS